MPVKTPATEILCPSCGEPFSPNPNSHSTKGHTKYCSFECYRQTKISKHPEKEFLSQLYWKQSLSTLQIAKYLNTSVGNISYFMKLYDIPTRTKSQAIREAQKQGRFCNPPSSWKGEYHQRQNSSGYVFIRVPEDYPFPRQSSSRRMIAEHIVVWEKAHYKRLPEGWSIHHLNGLKSDNRPQNLVALPNRKHIMKHNSFYSKQAERIRGLETEIELLKRALESQQGIFYFGEN